MASLLAGDQEVITRAIETSVRIKAEIVSADERESGERMLSESWPHRWPRH